MEKDAILYVDDESINLVNFRNTFARQFQISTAQNGEEALALLGEGGEVAVVIADQRMPGLSGIETLLRVQALYPDTVRIILTAFTETEDLINAINESQVYRYIVKPWDDQELRITIRNAVEKYRLTKQNRQILEELKIANFQLNRLNEDLEERVYQRTNELNQTNVLLERANTDLLASNFQVEAQARNLQEMNDVLNVRLQELESAIQNVKVLQGLLPICSYCKKIRDDQHYWQELEAYMRQYSAMEFTHCICPDCYERRVKPELRGVGLASERENSASSRWRRK